MSAHFNRAFIAVPISRHTKQKITTLQQELQNNTSSIRWTDHDQLHITLLFAGKQPQDEFVSFIYKLKKALQNWTPFSFELKGLGAFPSFRAPKIIWMGIDKGESQIMKMRNEIVQTLEKSKLTTSDLSRRYKPHLTIGRVKKTHKNPKIDIPEKYFHTSFAEKASSLQFIESNLTPSGPEYEIIDEHLLNA